MLGGVKDGICILTYVGRRDPPDFVFHYLPGLSVLRASAEVHISYPYLPFCRCGRNPERGPRKHRLLSSNRQIKVHHKNFHYGREIMLRLASCNKIVLILFPTLLLTAPVFSQDKPDTDETANLQKATQNPVASLISVIRERYRLLWHRGHATYFLPLSEKDGQGDLGGRALFHSAYGHESVLRAGQIQPGPIRCRPCSAGALDHWRVGEQRLVGGRSFRPGQCEPVAGGERKRLDGTRGRRCGTSVSPGVPTGELSGPGLWERSAPCWHFLLDFASANGVPVPEDTEEEIVIKFFFARGRSNGQT